jgi:fido (protein-threonine AMPylation protein)
MDHTSTRWWVRLEQGRSHKRVLRNSVLHSREQSLKPRQATRAQDRGQERLRLPRSSLRHTNLLRIHNFLYSDIEHMMVQQTTLATLLR